MGRHHRQRRKTLEKKTKQNQPKTTPKTQTPQLSSNGEIVKLLRELVELNKEMVIKIDGLGGSLGRKIDDLGQNLGQKIDSLGSKMDVLINHTRNIYMDLSETAFLNVFLEDLGDMGHKVSGVFVGDKVDYRVKVEKEKEKILYVEVEEVVVPSMVEEIIRKFEGIEKGEKWLLAKFIDSKALEMLKGTDINIYAYDPHKDSIGIIKGGAVPS
jgi:hypothetical protein